MYCLPSLWSLRVYSPKNTHLNKHSRPISQWSNSTRTSHKITQHDQTTALPWVTTLNSAVGCLLYAWPHCSHKGETLLEFRITQRDITRAFSEFRWKSAWGPSYPMECCISAITSFLSPKRLNTQIWSAGWSNFEICSQPFRKTSTISNLIGCTL
jgi:hypothetical protein